MPYMLNGLLTVWGCYQLIITHTVLNESTAKTMQQRCSFHLTDKISIFLNLPLLTFISRPNNWHLPPSSLHLSTTPALIPRNLFFLPSCLPPAVWLWVFWLPPDVDQTPVKFWTSHSIQTSFFSSFFFLFLLPFLSSCFFFPILYRLQPVHS